MSTRKATRQVTLAEVVVTAPSGRVYDGAYIARLIHFWAVATNPAGPGPDVLGPAEPPERWTVEIGRARADAAVADLSARDRAATMLEASRPLASKENVVDLVTALRRRARIDRPHITIGDAGGE
jgi:hypothetical protein